MSFVSIVSPACTEVVAETINDAVGYDALSYNWQANTGSNYFTFSTEPVRTEISSDYWVSNSLYINCNTIRERLI